MSQLIELRKKLAAKQDNLAEVWKLAGQDNDFSRKEVLDKLGAKDSAEAVEKVRALDSEVTAIFDELRPLAEMQSIRERNETIAAALGRPVEEIEEGMHPDPTHRNEIQPIGDVIVGSEVFKAYQKGKTPMSGESSNFGLRELRATLLESTTGFPPESVRSGRLVEGVTRPIQVLDIIPTGSTNQAAYKYMEETLRDHNPVEMREGATYAEDAFKYTEKMEPVQKIGTSIPVTDEQFEDVPGLASYLNLRLAFGLRQRFDLQVILGNGTPPNIEGITARSGIQTQAKGTDPVPDAVHKALTKVRVTGRANPTHIVMNPNDWQDVRLLRTADGIYIWGNPSEAGPQRIWGLPVVLADLLTENTALVGDFMFCQALEKRGVDIQVGYSGTQFVEGKKTVRADLRVAFCVYRSAAFCTVTSI